MCPQPPERSGKRPGWLCAGTQVGGAGRPFARTGGSAPSLLFSLSTPLSDFSDSLNLSLCHL